MIFVVERPAAAEPRAWFAFNDEDLLRKVAAADIEGLRKAHAVLGGGGEPAALAEAALRARGDCRIYWNESQAMAAFERRDDLIWQGAGWRAHHALREQLLALEVLAEDC